ncbi:MAG: Rne/Rng family ribonuclease [Candidatus Coproplasma sp.]
MTKKLYFDSHCGIDYYALCEDGVLCEYISQSATVPDAVGNVYKGKVTDVLNGMQAAFIDCGLERHCYISVADLVPDSKIFEGDVDIPTQLNLHEGDEIMVQITKPPVGKKGAKVTTNLSFVGKYIVYLPNTPFIGVSRKFSDSELKNNLIFSAKKAVRGNEGMIVRTAAPYAVLGDKMNELNFFRNTYATVKAHFEKAKVGELLYSDSTVHSCVLRDMMLTPCDEIHVGNKELFEKVKSIINMYPEREKPELFLHDAHTDMLYSEGISDEILKATQSKAELANGAYINIDRTEALTVIDVNTGKYTGENSLEDTVFATNVLATKEIARQVRLRNIGGIFVVDFIDMKEESHKKAIVQELEKALKGDKSRCKVLPMSQFGLVEFTRKRTGNGKTLGSVAPCAVCGGSGVTRTRLSIAAEFRAKLLEVLSGGAGTVCCDLNFDIANYVLNFTELKDDVASLYPQSRVYVVAHRTYKETAMYFRKVDKPSFTMPEGTMLLY